MFTQTESLNSQGVTVNIRKLKKIFDANYPEQVELSGSLFDGWLLVRYNIEAHGAKMRAAFSSEKEGEGYTLAQGFVTEGITNQNVDKKLDKLPLTVKYALVSPDRERVPGFIYLRLWPEDGVKINEVAYAIGSEERGTGLIQAALAALAEAVLGKVKIATAIVTTFRAYVEAAKGDKEGNLRSANMLTKYVREDGSQLVPQIGVDVDGEHVYDLFDIIFGGNAEELIRELSADSERKAAKRLA